MNDVPTALLVAAGAIAALMLATWLASPAFMTARLEAFTRPSVVCSSFAMTFPRAASRPRAGNGRT